MSTQFEHSDIVEDKNREGLGNKSRSTHSHDSENEVIYLYCYHSIWINISQLLGAYRVSTLQRYSKNQSDGNSNSIVDLYILPLIGIYRLISLSLERYFLDRSSYEISCEKCINILLSCTNNFIFCMLLHSNFHESPCNHI